jgi:hypothetical protein
LQPATSPEAVGPIEMVVVVPPIVIFVGDMGPLAVEAIVPIGCVALIPTQRGR